MELGKANCKRRKETGDRRQEWISDCGSGQITVYSKQVVDRNSLFDMRCRGNDFQVSSSANSTHTKYRRWNGESRKIPANELIDLAIRYIIAE